MSKLKEIWQIITRKDWKDGDEVHAIKMNGGLMVSNKLYETLKPELEDLPDTKTYYRDLYSMKIVSTPYLPYIYRKVRKQATPTIKENVNE